MLIVSSEPAEAAPEKEEGAASRGVAEVQHAAWGARVTSDPSIGDQLQMNDHAGSGRTTRIRVAGSQGSAAPVPFSHSTRYVDHRHERLFDSPSAAQATFPAPAAKVAADPGSLALREVMHAAEQDGEAHDVPHRDQLEFEDARPQRLEGGRESTERRADLHVVARQAGPSVAPTLVRLEAETSHDAGVDLRTRALNLPIHSIRRAEMLEDAADYLAFARLYGVLAPAPAAAPEAQRQAG